MESTEKITGTQLSLMIFSFIAPTVILVIPGLMASLSKQDAWITIFPAIMVGALSIWVMTTLSTRYPGQTIIQYSCHIIGKWPGKCLGLYYIYYWLNFDFIILNQHIQFINTVLLMRTPSIVISLTLAVLCGIAVYMGIEAIARCNESLSLLILVLLIPLLVLMLTESDPERLRPILSKGIVPVLQGSFFPTAYLSQFFILGWLIPFLNQPKKATKASFVSLFTISGLLAITILPLIMVFGPLTKKLTFPVLSVIQYIGLKGSFERLEALAVAIWVMGCFIKISVTFFVICLSLGHLFNIKNYKDFIIPITIMSVFGSISVFVNYSTDLSNYLNFTYPSYALFSHLLLPLALLMIDTTKRRLKKFMR
ncbi:endospore germination permease [Paenibacillus sp. 5J-6]|uniref:Endospore germination permease n=1 Tax=Paenibacillus silvestris TaxID=2606219 RepID=A0A6L8UTC2_9BACL|nr:endospore germination permease [Paenibacillus silvestris]MZQ81373.1 endospore germination permease [Paenibacillus silvestris]